ncbi:MAG: ornithine cyclodeaminase family protein [Verrucomicrobiales bacterium]|nr:ornithine cyclodeaminase family protein [Verrucomicrobiales bacterium]
MLILSAADVRAALPMAAAIEAMKQAFAAYSSGQATVPPRIHLDIPAHRGISLVMPAHVATPDRESLAVKVVSLFPGNLDIGLARIQSAVLAFDPATGRPEALLEGATLTALRTGAASGAATDLMAPAGARTAAIFGAGVQARTQLEAVCTVRPIETAWIVSRRPESADRLIAELAGKGPIPRDLRRATSAREALRDADIVCAATAGAGGPLFDDADLKPGAHVNAVGSFQPHVVEIPAATVGRSWVVVDSREAALDEAGDLIQAIAAGCFQWSDVRAELGELVTGAVPPPDRAHDGQVTTLFKSVGLAVQDALAARSALASARQAGLGTEVAW